MGWQMEYVKKTVWWTILLVLKWKKTKHLGVGRTLKKFIKVFFTCSDGQSVIGCLNEKISNNKNNTKLYVQHTALHIYKVSSGIVCGCMGGIGNYICEHICTDIRYWPIYTVEFVEAPIFKKIVLWFRFFEQCCDVIPLNCQYFRYSACAHTHTETCAYILLIYL